MRRWPLPRRWRKRDEHGASAVEFAILLPLLLVVLFGMIECGFVLAEKASLSHGVRAGARYGSVNLYSGTRTCGQVVTRALEQAETIGMQEMDISVTVKRGASVVCSAAADSPATGSTAPCTGASAAGTETLHVTASYETDFSIPLTGIDSPLTLESTGAYRCEYS